MAFPETGIEPEVIRETAREMARHRPATLVHPGRHSSWYGDDTQRSRAIALLNALLGSWGRKGGFYQPASMDVPAYPYPPYPTSTRGKVDNPGKKYPFASEAITNGIRDATITGQPYPIKGWFAYATNLIQAMHLPLSQVADGGLARSDKIVLYGDGGIHAAQAWMVLSGMGYQRVYTLLEGLDAWKDDVMFPIAPANPKPEERTRFERAAQVAKFFGGQPRAAVAPGAAPAEPPAVTPPAPPPAVITPAVPASSGVAAPPKKKREGC